MIRASSALSAMGENGYSKIFLWNISYFLKQIIAGAFITIGDRNGP
jgi:hypothetical protein